jgi:uncharacterized membrane protein YhaH (DUF805 family)
MTMTILSVLFSFKGRITRGQYWLGAILFPMAIGVLAGLYVAFIGASFSPEEVKNLEPGSPELKALAPLLLPFLAVLIVMIWSSAALYVKRLHDRNKGAVWLLAIYVPNLIALVFPPAFVLVIIAGLWAFIELGCLPGTQGPNRFDDADKSAYLDDVFGKPAAKNSSRGEAAAQGYGGMEAAMAAVAAAARSNPAPLTQIRGNTPAPPQFGQRAPGQFGRLNTQSSSGGFGRRV